MSKNASASAPAVTKITILVQTAVVLRTRTALGGGPVEVTKGGTPIPDATVELHGINIINTGPNGLVTFSIPDLNFGTATTLNIFIKVRKHHYGPKPPADQPVKPAEVGLPAFGIELTKGLPATAPAGFVFTKILNKDVLVIELADAGVDLKLSPPAIPARNMTTQQAAMEVKELHFKGEVQLDPLPDYLFKHFEDPTLDPLTGRSANALLPCDARCKMIKPPPKVETGDIPHPGRYNLVKGSLVNGVKYVYIHAFSNDAKSVFWDELRLEQLDPRHVVGIARFAKGLTARIATDITLRVIYHIGVGGSSGKDCHHWGRAVDFGGVSSELPDPTKKVTKEFPGFITPPDGGPRQLVQVKRTLIERALDPAQDFMVINDWFNGIMPWDPNQDHNTVPPAQFKRLTTQLPSSENLTDAEKTAAEAAGKKFDFPRLFYRLDGLPPGASTKLQQSARIFKAAFLQAQLDYQDKTTDTSQSATDPVSDLGEGKQILHPDYPKSASKGSSFGREPHRNHIHFQIGPATLFGQPQGATFVPFNKE